MGARSQIAIAVMAKEKELFEKIKKSIQSKKPLRVKLGVDPTSADIHLGHTVVLQKLRQFQDLGHQAVLIIGDYTALVGDPSGVQKTRPQLSKEAIQKNATTYFEQVKKVLDYKSLEIRYNGEWFQKISFSEVIQLVSRMTVARMLERDDFSKRFKSGSPICIHEFIYPLMQGYDSLMVQSDVELGGTDQLFNLLVGRQLQKEEGRDSQIVMTTPLLEGTDGIQKMSKSLNNAIGIEESPNEIYGKLMSINDTLMWKYYELLSQKSENEISQMREAVEKDKLNPKDVKMALAFEIVERFHSKKDASNAAEEFKRIFTSKKEPSEISEEVMTTNESQILVSRLIVLAKCAQSHAEARRLISQGGVSVNGKRCSDVKDVVLTKDEILLKVGKRQFKKIIFRKI